MLSFSAIWLYLFAYIFVIALISVFASWIDTKLKNAKIAPGADMKGISTLIHQSEWHKSPSGLEDDAAMPPHKAKRMA
jgi:hypothetical protein